MYGEGTTREEDTKKIDIRIVNLSKWQVDKPEGVFKDVSEGMPGTGDQSNRYLSIGHFDIVNVKKVEYKNGDHPFLQAYKDSPRHEQSTDEKYAYQELMVFTDVGEYFTGEYIEKFWSERELLLFISLIHVDNDDDIYKITKKIREIFSGLSYIYYFSFDYSGIVIFARTMTFSEYLQCVFRLNYEGDKEQKARALKTIRDSYSLFGFDKDILLKWFQCIKDKGYDEFSSLFRKSYSDICSERFSVSLNVSINEYHTFLSFKEKMARIDNKSGDGEENVDYRLFGRHDMAIVNNNADVIWIIYVHYLLNYDEGEPYFATYETFVKTENRPQQYKALMKEPDRFMEKVLGQLDALYKMFCDELDKLEGKGNKGQYKKPLCAVINSIKSISRNRFAEDFVLCMYKPFYDFIGYLYEKLVCRNANSRGAGDDTFVRCFDMFFKGLNSLVNSAMHSERQFVQATAFNAIIYDVPSKIMAFYVAMLDKLQKIIHTGADERHSFFLTPSFSDYISVEPYSFEKQKISQDRLLMVLINEKALFNPHAVVRTLAHEIAHFEGNAVRHRDIRKRIIVQALIRTALENVLVEALRTQDVFNQLVVEILRIAEQNEYLSPDKFNYSGNLLELGRYIAYELRENKVISDKLRDYVDSRVKKILPGDSSLRVYIKQLLAYYFSEDVGGGIITGKKITDVNRMLIVNLIMKDIKKAIGCVNWVSEAIYISNSIDDSIVSRINGEKSLLGEDVKVLQSVYSEAFSDMHMVLVTGITYLEYIRGFADEEKIDLHVLPMKPAHYIRIAAVSFTMHLAGIWDNVLDFDLSEKISDKSLELHRIIYERNRVLYNQFKKRENGWIDHIYSLASDYMVKLGEVQYEGFKMMELPATESQYRFRILSHAEDDLVVYLLNCMKEALEEYSAKCKEIKDVRATMKKVVEFENVQKVFSVICSVINQYKNTL